MKMAQILEDMEMAEDAVMTLMLASLRFLKHPGTSLSLLGGE